MYSKQTNKNTPILPYNATLGENRIIYDNMTYTRNISLCSSEMIKKESGNVIKFFRCYINQPQNIGGDTPKDAY